MNERASQLMDELNDLLDLERRALLSGDLEEVGRVLDTKEALLRELTENAASDTDGLQGLKEKLTRNQELIESAMKGIQAVAQRFATIRQVRKSLETYDSAGQRQKIEITSGGRLEKRA